MLRKLSTLPRTCGGCGEAGIEFDKRNVHDIYRHWHVDCIKDALRAERNDLIVIVENISGDFNLSSVIRSANQFSCREVWIAGRRKWDTRGAVGTNHYETINYAPDAITAVNILRLEGYTIIAADNVPGAVSIRNFDWPSKTALIFGEEQRGLSQEALDIADHVVYIQTRGSARSLNIASAATVMMHDYANKMEI